MTTGKADDEGVVGTSVADAVCAADTEGVLASVSHAAPAEVPPADLAPGAAFPIVGIGASAGGLAAFEAFFSAMPPGVDAGLAFVLVQHLSPDHPSILTELIQRRTALPVFEVVDGVKVRPNCVYVIPPNREMTFSDGVLSLQLPSEPRGQRMPIDSLFRSLALDQHARAIGVVLSGTGADGTLGLRAIKGEGGMVMAQTLTSAEYDGMPRSAIATGLVDYELPPAEMPAQIMAYLAHLDAAHRRVFAAPKALVESDLQTVFRLLRTQTGHDFSEYKSSTVLRRIERRLAVCECASVREYVEILRRMPDEVAALFRDLLIGVTAFFRDPEVFQALVAQIIPPLLAAVADGRVVRLWCVGCSTGEEAYSLAILLQEQMDVLKRRFPVQIFATDIDPAAIATARVGRYPINIAADVSPERLARYFILEPGGDSFRVHKIIRDMMVFSEHDLIMDPPFTRIDLLSCRNLLIYLNGELQERIIRMFHFALRPGGTLLLGTSESIAESGGAFAVIDHAAKLFRRELGGPRAPWTREYSLPTARALSVLRRPVREAAPAATSSLRELTEHALLQQFAAVGALVNARGDILYLHGRTGMYLEPSPGEIGVNNILTMAREGLQRDLSTALHKVTRSGGLVRCPGLSVRTNGHFTVVDLTVVAVATADGGKAVPELLLVVLKESNSPEVTPPAIRGERVEGENAAYISSLQHELKAQEDHLQSTQEKLETSNQELKSTNEEMQSVNEELQSTNEELETSREELQSVNEELSTVNAELQSKVRDLSRINDDMNNLLAGTEIGTVFVDLALRIVRFTPAATGMINLIGTDVGRSLAHVVTNLVGYDRLISDIQSVLETLIPLEMAVQTSAGRWYTMRVQPYRTLVGKVEGAVIFFVDISETVRATDALRVANARLLLEVNMLDAYDAITVQDMAGGILAWNAGAVRMYGWSEAEALTLNVRERIPPELREEALATLQRLSRADVLEPYRTRRLTRAGEVVEVSMISTALVNAAGVIYAIATTERALGSMMGRLIVGDQ